MADSITLQKLIKRRERLEALRDAIEDNGQKSAFPGSYSIERANYQDVLRNLARVNGAIAALNGGKSRVQPDFSGGYIGDETGLSP